MSEWNKLKLSEKIFYILFMTVFEFFLDKNFYGGDLFVWLVFGYIKLKLKL